MIRSKKPIAESPARLMGIWFLLLLVAAGGLAIFQRYSLIAELEQESTILHRLASQRADQHDAHLTALSAVALAAGGERNDLFLDLAATIRRFYPRIDEVQLVPLDLSAEVIGTTPLAAATAEIVREAARASDGRIMLLPHPDRPDHYIMIKRSPNTNAARYGLMLAIDAQMLVGEAGPFWSRPGVALRLTLPDGHLLVGQAGPLESIGFAKPLGSASQPLIFESAVAIGLADLFPPLPTALVLAAVSLAYFAALAGLRQRARARLAVEQARLSALETRLAHASRVNALGEMASGLSHELTQPLTAILAQVQAGRRMLGQGEGAALGSVLDDTVAQARRASAILERFRNWSRLQRTPASAFDLRDALKNVQALLTPEAAARGIRLDLDIPETAVPVVADPVEMEQIAFNLVHNAIEATAGGNGAGHVRVSLREEDRQTMLEVADNGPGVPEELRPLLFTPFTTTRADGTGLGLALSQRLAERAGGEIVLVESGPGATFRVVLPRATRVMEAA